MHSYAACITLKISLLFFIIRDSSAAPNSHDGSFELSIIHFSDFHARYMQVAPDGGLCYDYNKEACVGGIARVATIVRRLKEIRRNAIFLNAGDCFQGTLYYDIYRGNITAHFMNLLPHDAITIGNHDFDDQISGLASYVKKLKAPIVVTNIDYSEEPLMRNLYTNSTIIRKAGKDIGVIGVIFSGTDKISSTTGKLKFLDEVETVNLEAKKLKARGVNILIVLSHCGIEQDKIIAKNAPDVDVIVGGHSHILLFNGKPPSNEDAYDKYPVVITQNKWNRKVLIVHASAFTKYMGDIRIVFDSEGEVANWKGNPIYLNNLIKEDSSVLEDLQPWKEIVDRIGQEAVGKTVVFLNGSCKTGECNLGNLVADAMIDKHSSNNAAISFITANSIQNSIPVGPIVFQDIYATLPYNNTWNLIELQGVDFLQVLEENAISQKNTTFYNAKLFQWSGLKVVYNLTNELSKVVSAKVRCLDCGDNKFENLDPEKWYRIVVPTYLLSKDFEIIFKKHRNLIADKSLDIDNMVDYIKKIKIINIRRESRMIFV